MNFTIPSRLAEIIYALIMAFFGVMHFMNTDIMSGMVPEAVPGSGVLWIYVTGVGLLGAALAILVQVFKKPACYLLALMLLIFVFTIHLQPAMEGNAGNLLKDSALAMAAILIGNRVPKKH